jgi:hypothetical protein
MSSRNVFFAVSIGVAVSMLLASIIVAKANMPADSMNVRCRSMKEFRAVSVEVSGYYLFIRRGGKTIAVVAECEAEEI